MGAVIDRFAAVGVTFDLLEGGHVRACGELTEALRTAIRTHKSAILEELAAAGHYRWRIDLPGRTPFEVRVLPESTADEMREHYPGATIAAIPDAPARCATQSEAAELRRLIEYVIADAPEEWDWVHGNACTDAEGALRSFRILADEARERAIWGPKR